MKTRPAKRLLAIIMAAIMTVTICINGNFVIGGASKAEAAEITINLSDYRIITSEQFIYGTNTISKYSEAVYNAKEIKYSKVEVKNFDNSAQGTALDPKYYTIRYLNNINVGKATLAVVGNEENGCTGVLIQTFDIKPKDASKFAVTLNGLTTSATTARSFEYSKGGVYPKLVVKNGSTVLKYDKDYTYEFYNNNELGTADTAEYYGGPCVYISGEGNFTGETYRAFTIKQASMSKQILKLKESNYVYSGSAIMPEAVVYDVQSGLPLEKDVDYTVSYSNNNSAGQGTVTVTGINNYTGTLTANFTILAAGTTTYNIADATVSVPACEYTGEAIIPDVTVTYGGKQLVKDTDYTISAYSNNVNAGNASITIAGLGSYTGSKTVSFSIAKRDASKLSSTASSVTYNHGYVTNGADIVVTDSETGRTLVIGDDYSISYEKNTSWDVGEGIYTVKCTGNYTGTKDFNFTITPYDIVDADIKLTYYEYTGSPIEPKCTIKYGNRTLVEGEDYKITGYVNNIQPGIAHIYVEGINNYTGSKSEMFEITTNLPDIANAKITGLKSTYPYTGSAVEPEFTVQFGDEENGYETLVKGTDYTVEYGNNTERTTSAYVRITGTGTKYVGTKLINFSIIQKGLEGEDVVVDMTKSVYEYTGEVINPEYTVTYNGMTLVKGTDFKELYIDGYDRISQGQQILYLSGTGNYNGLREIKFTIEGPQGSLGDVSIDPIDDIEYTGSEITPVLNMTLGDYSLAEGRDYEIECTDNIIPGTATVHITGIGTFSGERYLTFKIVKKDLENCDISLVNLSAPYDLGTPIEPSINTKNGSVSMVEGTDYEMTVTDNVEAGIATVTLTGLGNYTGEKVLHFEITKLSILSVRTKITDVEKDFEYTGDPIEPKITVMYEYDVLTEGVHYEVTYSNNTNLTTDDNKAVAKVTGIGSFEDEATQYFRIVEKDISDCYVETIPDQAWTGSAVKPSPEIRNGGEEGKLLVEGKDYTLSYQDNIDAGKATVIIQGINNYTGTLKVYFMITKAVYDINDSVCSISDIEDKVYNYGAAITPEISITYDGTALEKDKDFTVIYMNNSSVGTASVTIKGAGLYSGEKTIYFDITPLDISKADITGVDDKVEYTGEEITFNIVVKMGSVTLNKGTDYTVSYDNNTNVSDETNSAMITVTGKGNYTGNATVAFVITQKDISNCSISSIETQSYTGLEICPSVSVSDGLIMLVENQDYTVAYENNINPTTADSKARVIVTGIGNYKGELEASFDIEKDVIDIKNGNISPIDNQVYCLGTALTPEVTVSYNDVVLENTVDYTVSYSNNINAGTATVTVSGIGDYKGTLTADFVIEQLDISGGTISGDIEKSYSPLGVDVDITGFDLIVGDDSYSIDDMDSFVVTLSDCDKVGTGTIKVTAKDGSNYKGYFEKDITISAADIKDAIAAFDKTEYEYTGEAVIPQLTVTYEGTVLSKNVDYTLTYSDNTSVGTAGVTIKGKGNYTGELLKTFVISAASISSAEITANDVDYTGSNVAADITVVHNGKTLIEGTDYTVVFDNETNIDVGEVSFTIEGINDFSGSKKGSFRILAKDISLFSVEGIKDAVYSGSSITYEVKVSSGETVLSLDKDYSITYSNNINAGTAKVVITGKGNYKGSIEKTFKIDKLSIKDGTLSISGEEFVYTGSQITPSVTSITCANGTVIDNIKLVSGITVSYGENIHSGKGSIVVTADEISNYSGNIVKEFVITKKDISDAIVTVDDAVYTGSAIIPEYSIVLNGYNLTADDYTVECKNNINISSPTNEPYILITGKGDYEGEVIKNFAISAASINDAVVSITGTYTYTGLSIEPTYTVSLGDTKLTKDVDYTATLNNNIDAGEASITIKGTGNYVGEKTEKFTIGRKSISTYEITGVSDKTYTGNPITFDIVVSDGSESLTEGVDYTVSYNNNTNVSSDDAKAEVVVTAKGNYTGKITKSFNILGVSLDDVKVSGVETSAVYTGSAIRFTNLKLVYGDYTLVNGTDYSVAYENNTNVSAADNPAKLKITGLGSFTGELNYTFAITAKGLDSCSVGNIEGQLYTGLALTPDVTIKDGSYTLVNGKDYEITYSNNIDVTTDDTHAVAVITGKGNYSGTVNREFTISYKVIAIDAAVISFVSEEVYIYDFGNEITPAVMVTIDGKELTNGTDYTVSYTNNINAGTASVVITGKREYKGSISKSFTIYPYDVSKGSISLEKTEFTFTGQPIKPVVADIFADENNTVSVIGDDSFTYSYINNTNAGTATLTITAKSGTNYTGSIATDYLIIAESISGASVIAADQGYTGNELRPEVNVTLNGTKLVQDTDYLVTYRNNINAGTADITITGKGNYQGEALGSFKISPKNIGTSIIAVEDQMYTGEEISPKIVVTNGSKTLEKDVDYILTITDNTNKGTARISIEGIGNYTGTMSGSFEISARDIADCDVSDIDAVIYNGAEQTPAVVVTYNGKTLELAKDYSVAYSDNINVTTTAKKAKVVITGKGNYSGTVTKSFDITPAGIETAEVAGIPDEVEYTGNEIKLSGVTVTLNDKKLEENADYTIAYTDNKEVGTATVVITGAGSYSGTVSKTFAIVSKDVANCQVDAIPGQKYTGTEIKPLPVVKNGDVTLVLGTDYDVAYANNTNVTTTAEVIITGKGNYTGTVTVNFTISRDIVDIKNAEIQEISSTAYNFGEAIEPVPVVTYNNTSLVEGTDYTVSYENNINAGTANVIITGKGYYSGTKTVSFEITPYSINQGNVVLEKDSYEYTGSAVSPAVTGIVISGKPAITDMSLFVITYKNNVNVGTEAEVLVTAKDGTNFEGAVSGSFMITATSLAAADILISDVEYTGNKLTPKAVVSLNGSILSEGTDYEALYESNTSVGTAKITVVGKGNYSGSASETFRIIEKSISDAIVTVENQLYTGKELTPPVSVTLGDKTLVSGTDYTVSYSDNINVGNAIVVVTGIGNYKNTVSETFKITAMSIADADILPIADKTYTGSDITPSVTVHDNKGNELIAGTDYVVTYKNNVNVTTADSKAVVTITGKGNYQGASNIEFNILPASINGAEISGYEEVVSYTGKEIVFNNITVKLNNEVLEPDNYDISYTGNIYPTDNDNTFFTITGKGNYSGSVIRYFEIKEKSLAECVADEIEGQLWTGSAITPEVVVRNGSVILVNGVDYDVTYENNTDVTTDTQKAKAIITGKGNYSGTVIKEFVISKEIISINSAVIGDISDQVYAFGDEIKPELSITYNGKTLSKDVDYKLEYTNNINVGTAKVKVTGVGSFNGSKEIEFVINKADISKAEAILRDSSVSYTGSPITVAVTRLTLGDKSITDITAFDITYSDNTNAGTAKVTITAKADSNYSGTVTQVFAIVEKSIAGAEILVDDAEYTGSAVTPQITVTLDGIELEENKDYTVSFSNNTDVTTGANVSITGIGNYTGSVGAQFEITAKSIDNVVINIPSQEYTGLAIKPAVTITVGGKTLVENEDYTISYSNNTNVTTADSKALVTIRGINNYTGRIVAGFDITAKDISKLSIDSIEAKEYTGSEITPPVVIKDGNTTLVVGRDYEVSYDNNIDISTEATIVITGKGNYSGSKEIKFEICSTSIARGIVTGIGSSATYTGNAITFSNISVVYGGNTLVNGTDYTVAYENNINVTTRDSKAYVVIKGIGNYGGEIRTAFDITPMNLSACTVNEVSGQIYTGNEVKPKVTVKNGNITLTEGVDYTLSYSNNINVTTDTSKAVVVITGLGNYTGEVSKEFTIAREIVDISSATISDIADCYYNYGAAITPDIVVTYNGRTLEKGVDYSVSYENNTLPGDANVIVTAIGSNTGVIRGTFKIIPIDITNAKITLAVDSVTYEGLLICPHISNIAIGSGDSAVTITNLDAFDVEYSQNENVGTGIVSVKAIEGKGFSGVASTTFKIVPASVNSAIVTVASVPYTGNEIVPDAIVKVNGRTLVKGVDYTLSAENNVNVGTSATLIVTGCGNYTGTTTKTFAITAKNISECTISDIASVEYTGNELKPNVTIKNGGVTLVADTDYTVSYENNTNVSNEAKVVITGKGNYTGSTYKTFAITKASIKEAAVNGIDSVTYTGSAIVFDSISVELNGKQLVKDTDYTISYNNNVNAGSAAEVVITGKGNFTDSVRKTFTIEALDVTSIAVVSGVPAEMTYTGSALMPEGVTVSVNGKNLVLGTDYTVSCNNNINVTNADSAATYIVTFKGNYKGNVYKSFAIVPCSIESGKLDAIPNQGYTGSEIKPEIAVTVNGNKLTDSDFDVSYSDNIGIGTAKVVVTGKGNYTGALYGEFVIVPAKVSGLTFAYALSTTSSTAITWNKLDGAEGYYVFKYDESTKTYKQIADVTDTKYVISSLNAGTSYKLAVCAYITLSDNTRLEGVKAYVNATTCPAAVTGIKNVSRTDKSLTIAWNKVFGATGYRVYKYDAATKKYVAIKTLTGTSLEITGLGGGTEYLFKINAYKSIDGKTLWSKDATAKFATTVSSISGLKLVKRGTNTITFKWNKVSGADGYNVFKYNNKTRKYVKIKTITNPATTKFVSSKLKAGTTYTYKVCAFKKNGTVSITGGYGVFKNTTLPATPIIRLKSSSKQATVRWRRVARANGYQIFMSTKKNGKYKRVATVKNGKKIKYTKKKLKSGKTYYFKIRAYKKYNGRKVYSAYSTIKKIKVK